MLGRHIADRLMGCRFQALSLYLQCMLMRYGSQLASRECKCLETSSFACNVHHFLEERDELLFNLLSLFIRHFPVDERIGHELLDVGCIRCNVRTLRYHLTFLAAIYRSLDLL